MTHYAHLRPILSRTTRQHLSSVTSSNEDPTPPQLLLTRADVAQQLATSIRHVRRLIEEGRLPSVRLGGLVRVRVDQLDEFVSDLTSRNQTPNEPDRIAA
jgi:excisionase family DNA binding protein